MKTVFTILPIYDSLAKRDWQRTGALMPVLCPRHRLPSFQYNTEAVAVGAVTTIELVNFAGTLVNITTYFPTLSDTVVLATTGTYYKYDGDTLNYLLPYGNYYLKITHGGTGYIYYSEWFAITNIYDKLVTSFLNVGYEGYSSTGSVIGDAQNTVGGGIARSNQFALGTAESITAMFYLTRISGAGTEPTIALNDSGAAIPDVRNTTAGLNVVTFASQFPDNYYFEFENSAASHWEITEFYAVRNYSPNFIRIDFHDTHDLGDICYQSGFTQSLWLETQLNRKSVV